MSDTPTIEVRWENGYGRGPRNLIRDPSLSERARLLFVILEDYASPGRQIFPSHQTLADYLGCSRRSVIRAMTELEESGWISVTQREGTSNLYVLHQRGCDTGVTGGVTPVSQGGVTRVSHEAEPVEAEPVEAPSDTADFAETIWQDYPRKVDKAKAVTQIVKRIREGTQPEHLQSATLNYADWCEKSGRHRKHILHGATFYGPSGRWQECVDGHPEPIEQDERTAKKQRQQSALDAWEQQANNHHQPSLETTSR